jgi:hypothetical protein
MMIIGLRIEPSELFFQYVFDTYANGTYNFYFVFPFNITGMLSASENMSYRSTPHGSVIWLRHEVDDVIVGVRNGEIYGSFSVENTFQAGTRGVYTFFLPFGMGIYSDVIEGLWQDLHINIHSPDAEIRLDVGLPSRYQRIQAFPSFNQGLVTSTSLYDNRTITTIEWTSETLQNPVTIYCDDPEETAYYDRLLFTAALFIGIGVPLTMTTIYEALKEWSKNTGSNGLRYWLNIDKPSKKCILHTEGCTYETNKEATPNKGLGEIKRDGGWLSFSSRQETSAYFKHKWASRGYELSEGCRCLK